MTARPNPYTIEVVPGERLTVEPDRPQTPVHSPGEALEAHLKLLQWMHTNHAGVMLRHLYERRSARYNVINPPERTAMAHQAMMIATLNYAETIYVSAEMCALVEALAETTGHDVPALHLTDVPYNTGLIVLGAPQPFLPPDLSPDDPYDVGAYSRTRGLLYRMFRPGPMEYQVGNTTFVLEATGDEADSRMAMVQEHGGLVVWELYDAGTYLTTADLQESWGRPSMIPAVTTAIPFGVRVPWDDKTGGSLLARYLVALLRLMWQRVLRPDDWHPPRAMKRRFERHRPIPEDGAEVKVVHLRRTEPGWGDPAPVDTGAERPGLRYTTPVRAHPREQWYPSLGPARLPDGSWNEASHRTIWIEAFLRGQGPLIRKHGLTAVVR